MKQLSRDLLLEFKEYLISEEKSEYTVEKYMRDVSAFSKFAGENKITKELVMNYKQKLISENYAVRSINSMLASVNALLSFMELSDCRVKSLKQQRKIFCEEEKELTKTEYIRLVNTAGRSGRERLSLIIQTICSTGIRVSELRYITVDAVRQGKAVVNCKGKTRDVFIVRALQKSLLGYIKKSRIKSGSVFVTRSGAPVSRTNIWREMKNLCREAEVNPSKVFPHNLRHLFARVFYSMEKDIAKLADILGHSSINTTRIYIISTGCEHRQKLEKMRLTIT